MTPEEYFKLCEAHDWRFDMSEDHAAFVRGAREVNVLLDNITPHEKIHEAWASYAFNGGPKPQLSDFVPQTNRP